MGARAQIIDIWLMRPIEPGRWRIEEWVQSDFGLALFNGCKATEASL